MIKALVLALALVAVTNATLTCNGGYYKMYTRKTYNWSHWGPWNCLSVGIPCAGVTGAAAEAAMKREWEVNGGKSWKAWTKNAWCTGETSGSAPWQGIHSWSANQTWRFSLLPHRRMNSVARILKHGKKHHKKHAKKHGKKHHRKLAKKGKKHHKKHAKKHHKKD